MISLIQIEERYKRVFASLKAPRKSPRPPYNTNSSAQTDKKNQKSKAAVENIDVPSEEGKGFKFVQAQGTVNLRT